MGFLTLNIVCEEVGQRSILTFDPSMLVYDACTVVRNKFWKEVVPGKTFNTHHYGLFRLEPEPSKCVWMENSKSLEHYLIRNNDTLQYKSKIRQVKVRTLDGSIKTVNIDESQIVGQLMITICSKIGIFNYEEYSLVREDSANCLKKGEKQLETSLYCPNKGALQNNIFGTIYKKNEKKLENLRHKLHTDEELNWVENLKTFLEQDIHPDQVLILRRKFFFSDANVERDPVQLHLLYVQCRDDVLKGTHPVTKDIACRLAALQAFIEFGPHNDLMTGSLDFKTFLPKEHAKKGETQKKAHQCYEFLKFEEPVFEPKKSYIRECKDLNTYGVTFFVVKEKQKGRNKLMTVLLGINKDCVMRLNKSTKEVIQEYPLEQILNWANSSNTFVFNFGDYREGVYSVATKDGDKIGTLLAGYIDIIIKKRLAKDHLGVEGDEGAMLLEEQVAPAKATLITHTRANTHIKSVNDERVALAGVIRQAQRGEIEECKVLDSSQYGFNSPMYQGENIRVTINEDRSQQALHRTIHASQQLIDQAEEELYKEVELASFEDPSTRKWIQTQTEIKKEGLAQKISAMGAATAEVVQLTALIDDSHHKIANAIATISSNLPEMGRNVRDLAALMYDEDKSGQLLEATKRLCGAFSNFLNSVNPQNNQMRSDVFKAAGHVGEYCQDVLDSIEEKSVEDQIFHDQLVQKAKCSATTMSILVLKAKNISGDCTDPILKERVIQSATQCAFATSQLVACTRVVAPTITSPNCQEQVYNASKQVSSAIGILLDQSKHACHMVENGKGGKYGEEIQVAARSVIASLDDLLDHIKVSPRQRRIDVVGPYENMLRSSNRLISNQDSGTDMVEQSQSVIRHSLILVDQMENEAADQDPQTRALLLSNASRMAQATSQMIDATKECEHSPLEPSHQMHLKTCTEKLVNLTSSVLAPQNATKVFEGLEQAAKRTAACSTQTIGIANQCVPLIKSEDAAGSLIVECKETAAVVPDLIASIRESQNARTQADKFKAQSQLIHDAFKVIPPATNLVEVARRTVSSVPDQDIAENLQKSSQRLAEQLNDLRIALNNAHQLNYDLTLLQSSPFLTQLDDDLLAITTAYDQAKLQPLPHETPATSTINLITAARKLGSSLAQVVSSHATTDKQHLGGSAIEVAYCLRQFVEMVHGVCSTRNDTLVHQIVSKARIVVRDSGAIFTKIRLNEGSNELGEGARAVTLSIRRCLDVLPDNVLVDNAINRLRMLEPNGGPSNQNRVTLTDIRKKADGVIESNGLLMMKTTAPEQGHAVQGFVDAYIDFHDTISGAIVGWSETDSWKQTQFHNLKCTTAEATNVLTRIKARVSDLNTPQMQQGLIGSTRTLTEVVNIIVEEFGDSSPWMTECDNSLRQIESCRHILDSALFPVNSLGYYESLEGVTEQAKRLGEGMTGIARNAKAVDTTAFCKSLRIAAEAVCGLAELASQSAYLVGVSDLSSVPGKAALLNIQQFETHLSIVNQICGIITNQDYHHQSLLNNATILAQNTSGLASLCRQASDKSTNVNVKKQFVQCGRDIASHTALLISSVKVVDRDFNNASKKIQLSDTARSLISAAEQLHSYITHPEFNAVPAKISARAEEAQGPILDNGRGMLEASCGMIRTARELASCPKDASTWQKLADNSKVVSDSIKKLVTAIREECPGQLDLEDGISRLNEMNQIIDNVALTAYQGKLPKSNVPAQRVQQQIIHAAQSIVDRVDSFKKAANFMAEQISHEVRGHMLAMESLVQSGVDFTSMADLSQTQSELLSQFKTVLESELQLMISAKVAGGNPNAIHSHYQVEESGALVNEALTDLQRYIKVLESEAGVTHAMIDSISRSIALTDQLPPSSNRGSFADAQTTMVGALAILNKLGVDAPLVNPAELGALTLKVSDNYQRCAEESRLAVSVIPSQSIAHKIRVAVQKLGASCILLVKEAAQTQANPLDERSPRELSKASNLMIERVQEVLAALHEGSKGTQACINAANTVSNVISDLDTTIRFANSGSLPRKAGKVGKMSDHKDNIFRIAKILIEDTKALVTGAASNQEQLAVAAQNAVKTILALTEAVKNGACNLAGEHPEAQVMVIHSVRDVAGSLSNLIHATKCASGHQLQDPPMINLKEAAKMMATNVAGLLKTASIIENGAKREVRALESAIEAIEQQIKLFNIGEGTLKHDATPDHLIQAARIINDVIARAMSSISSLQSDEMIAAANISRSSVNDLLSISNSVASTTESAEMRYKITDQSREVAILVKELMGLLLSLQTKQASEGEIRKEMVVVCKDISNGINDLINLGEHVKGDDWVNSADLSSIAETELLGAASSIEAASLKLAQLKPPKNESEVNLSFDECIVGSACSITSAVKTLVQAASLAQRELVLQGRLNLEIKNSHGNDYQWSEGLISAARMVVASVHQLCEAANGVVLNQDTEEKLVSAAKQVAASTAHLLVACKVKADVGSKAMQKLQNAGFAVKTATEKLVAAAKKSITQDDRSFLISEKFVSSVAQVIDAQSQVFKREKELTEARNKLATVYKSRYEKNDSLED
uniref:FERM domain-containing protein n=1 Tax=Rhabditophanes sp. KR3021 TaxID=114890 RepID=A0AC35TRB9_9BILA